jgi:hypothetical protein
LAHNSCTEECIVIFTYVLTKYLIWIHPLSHSSSSPSPALRTISTGLILLYSYMNTKYIHHIHPGSHFPYAHLPPTITHPQK